MQSPGLGYTAKKNSLSTLCKARAAAGSSLMQSAAGLSVGNLLINERNV